MLGTIRFYDFKKGSGYITGSDNNLYDLVDNIFNRQYPDGWSEGDLVEFELVDKDYKLVMRVKKSDF